MADQHNEENNIDHVNPEDRTVHHHKRTGVPLTRKRKRDPANWKKNIRKKKRQSGQKYINSQGNEQAARSVKTKKDCSKCKYRRSIYYLISAKNAIQNRNTYAPVNVNPCPPGH